MGENTNQKLSESPLAIKIARAGLIVLFVAICFSVFVVVGFEYDRSAATQKELSSAASDNPCVREKIKDQIKYELSLSSSGTPISRYMLELFISGCEDEALLLKQAEAIQSEVSDE
jgi:hypothetical protein